MVDCVQDIDGGGRILTLRSIVPVSLLTRLTSSHHGGFDNFFRRPIREVHVSSLLVNGHLSEIYCWPGDKDATGQRGQVHHALSKHVPVPVLAEGKLVQAALKVPGTKQAVVSGPLSRAHCSILPPTLSCDAVLRGVMTSRTTCVAPIGTKLFITAGGSTEAVTLSVISVNIPLRAWSTIVSKPNS